MDGLAELAALDALDVFADSAPPPMFVALGVLDMPDLLSLLRPPLLGEI